MKHVVSRREMMNTNAVFSKAIGESQKHIISSDHCREQSTEFRLLREPWLWEAVSVHPRQSSERVAGSTVPQGEFSWLAYTLPKLTG